MKTISVIVPFFNSRKYISRCVDGLLGQAYPRELTEILMIDNNSTDGSAEAARKDARIRVLSQPKQGSYAARNRGLQEARGEIVAFTDADCVASPRWLAEIDGALRDDRVGIVLGSHRFAGASPLVGMLAAYENEKKAYVYGRADPALYYGQTNNMAVRRTLIEQEGGFVETVRGADTLFVRKCVAKYSPEIARYCRTAEVTHLEIDGLAAYWRKVFIYGASSRRFGPVISARPLSAGDRARIFRQTTLQERYSARQASALLGILLIGLASWAAGAVSVASGARRQETAPMSR
jgi:glycosyltransferase involved in cell wall biosynthesis